MTEERVKATTRNIRSLIGKFRIDPNRVCDLVLEGFERQPGNRLFVPLLGTPVRVVGCGRAANGGRRASFRPTARGMCGP